MQLSHSNESIRQAAGRFHHCCRAILSTHRATTAAGLRFAVGYAKAGLGLWTQDGMRVQANYILANISGWRGPEARQVRAELKALVEELKA